MYSRREFGGMMLAGLPLALLLKRKIDPTVNGVRLGAITYSFHDMPNIAGQDHVDMVIDDCKGCGVGLLELMSNHVEPVSEYMAQASARRGASPGAANAPAPVSSVGNGAAAQPPAGSPATAAAVGGAGGGGRGRSPEAMKARDDLRQWRLTTPISHFDGIKKKLNDAGIVVYAYGMGADFTSDEIDKMFEQAKALGAVTISSSTTLDVAQKLVPFAEKHQFPVAFHNHEEINDPNQFAKPESFEKAIAMSKYFRINLDIGYITGSNYDAVSFIQDHHERITHLHMKDRKKDLGPSVPWGQGDTPVKPVLTLLKEKRYPIPALVELSYPVPADSNCVQEVSKCMAFMKQALAG